MEEFAARMKIVRTTVFDWMKTGKLVQGRHYLKVGRTIRIPWPRVLDLLMAEGVAGEPEQKPRPTSPVRRRSDPPKRPGPAIDLDYS
ncbi:MAG: hypothetical protein GWN87_23245 [Desulfuromonadales bacterium]|nr:hypothetical protein [Desulfuromonadales bacterium]